MCFCRQVTPYDDVCHTQDASGKQIGERIFGDCDDLMREIMLQLLSEKEYQEWTEGRKERMKKYNSLRS